MLIRFRAANFRSLRDEQELSMVAALRGGRRDLLQVEGLAVDLLRVAGIYGPNAAGKSNVLDALLFMAEAVVGSHRLWPPEGPIPREPFLLDRESRGEPSLFEVDLVVEGVNYQYGFVLDDERILEEWLHAFPNGRRQVWFSRDVTASEPFVFGKKLKGNNRLLARLTRPNCLFLSVAAGYNHEALFAVYRWFARELRSAAAQERVSWTAFQDLIHRRELKEEEDPLLDLLQRADLGVTGFEVRQQAPGRSSDDEDGSIRSPDGSRWTFELTHQAGAATVALPLSKESRGTRAWLSLLGPILETLESGSLLCVDEIDASLHPHLAVEVIQIFQDPGVNPNGAQLLFNTHDTSLLGTLLGEPVLHRDQVWFVEKDRAGASRLYPLTDFKPRKLENIERGYFHGRYGAIPFLSPRSLLHVQKQER
jgi:AAA15 family ATPase/GTPase